MNKWRESEIIIKIPRPIEVCYRLMKFTDKVLYRGMTIDRGMIPDGNIQTIHYDKLGECTNPDPQEVALWVFEPHCSMLTTTKDKIAEDLYDILIRFNTRVVNLDIIGVVPYKGSDVMDLHFFAFVNKARIIDFTYSRAIFPLLPKLGWVDVEQMITGTRTIE